MSTIQNKITNGISENTEKEDCFQFMNTINDENKQGNQSYL